MRLTCPFCRSEAILTPNPAHAERAWLPRYLLNCSGCDRTSVRSEPDACSSMEYGWDEIYAL